MTATAAAPNPASSLAPPARRRKPHSSLLAHGEPSVWLTGGALAVCLMMIGGLLGLVAWQGTRALWPNPLVEFDLNDGSRVLGEVSRIETFAPTSEWIAALPDGAKERAQRYLGEHGNLVTRRLVRTGNFDITGEDYRWIHDWDVKEMKEPAGAMLLERVAWGRFIGWPKALLIAGAEPISEPAAIATELRRRLPLPHSNRVKESALRAKLGESDEAIEAKRLALKSGSGDAVDPALQEENRRLRAELDGLANESSRDKLVLTTADGKEKAIELIEIVRPITPNDLTLGGKIQVYLSRIAEFLTSEPREANSEGGVFPAIFGTMVMTLTMSLAVAPFGVMAALYLREYAKPGLTVSAVRIAVNNLAGVPSIVFGVFGLGFFCYLCGATIDQLFFSDRLPNPTFGKGGILWSALTLALLTLPVVIVATEEALAAVPRSMREGSFACGASQWQTIRRIVLPRALPGIMTGMILAMARGAGEVAPLMLVGAVKLAPELPIDTSFPFAHPERSFMHLGYHLFDLGFHSRNSEAAKPMIFATTLLLIGLIAVLNLLSVWLRARLRQRFAAAKF